jgi:HAE1 family hydrophobic/amphiphilic exporter-1
LLVALEAAGGYVDLDKSLKLGRPELRVIPDREKAAALGVDADQLSSTVRAMVGGLDVGTFKEGGNRYDIRMRLDRDDRDDPEEILDLYARTRSGEVVELRNLVSIEKVAAPSTITRVDRQRAVRVSANLIGKDPGTALEEVLAIGESILPDTVSLVPSGGTEEMMKSFDQLVFMQGLSILLIYMILAAQFESFVHPLTVMLALPLAMVGAFGGLSLAGMTLNIFSMIGIILLFGLATKNSILLVDYTNQLRQEGLDKITAVTTAAPVRMRPVLMTALSMIFGVAPAALGIGPGSESRAPMAVAAGAGMISSTALTLLVVPVFYLVLDDAIDWVRALLKRGTGSGPEPQPVAGSGA